MTKLMLYSHTGILFLSAHSMGLMLCSAAPRKWRISMLRMPQAQLGQQQQLNMISLADMLCFL